MLLNTAGGITGGDVMQCDLHAGRNSTLTATTQACERIYKAQPGQTGVIRNMLRVDPGARLNWLPQETILFDHCNLDRALSIDLAEGASLLMVEPMVFGRMTMQERLTHAKLRDRIDIRRSGQPLYLDRVCLEGDVSAHLDQAFIANGAHAMANVVFVHPSAEAKLDPLRALLPDAAGASLLGDDILVARILASDSFKLREGLLPVLRLLNSDQIPRCWMV